MAPTFAVGVSKALPHVGRRLTPVRLRPGANLSGLGSGRLETLACLVLGRTPYGEVEVARKRVKSVLDRLHNGDCGVYRRGASRLRPGRGYRRLRCARVRQWPAVPEQRRSRARTVLRPRCFVGTPLCDFRPQGRRVLRIQAEHGLVRPHRASHRVARRDGPRARVEPRADDLLARVRERVQPETATLDKGYDVTLVYEACERASVLRSSPFARRLPSSAATIAPRRAGTAPGPSREPTRSGRPPSGAAPPGVQARLPLDQG